ncbi:MAG: peptidase T [Bacteroidetes bacterium]|nr:peptidase T [Bacteroidota bacterium]
MNQYYPYNTADRLMRYVQIDTQSDPHATIFPSTDKQKRLSVLLAAELKELGISDAHADEYGYVYATIPSNVSKTVPVICFLAHVDTAPDCSGTDVKPILHAGYDGKDIVLPDDTSQTISISKYPYLKGHIGHDIITASGNTLLGGDDKAGVAIIMSMAAWLMHHSEIPHGDVKIVFTPDEEVGRGTEKIDIAKIGAVAGYTLDGGQYGSLEEETFSADGVKLFIHGISAHPGSAKGTMVNALKIASDIIAALPRHEWSPETTEKREGFVHPLRLNGTAEKAEMEFLIRDFSEAGLQTHADRLRGIVETIIHQYPGSSFDFHVKEQYRNMKSVLDQHPAIVANAEAAYQRCKIPVLKEPVRGGTDGSRLSFMGLPCLNLFTGMQAIHSKHEWIGVRDMEESVRMLIELVKIWEEKA